MIRKKSNLRVALYARTCAQHPANQEAIEMQLTKLRQRIARDGCTIQENAYFVDTGVSAARLTRPALERLRDQVTHGAFDRVYILSADRLTRRAMHHILLQQEFAKADAVIIYLDVANTPHHPSSEIKK